jgi:hypothetical protein
MKASLPICPVKGAGRTAPDNDLDNSLTVMLARSSRNQVTLVPGDRVTRTGKERPMNSHLAAYSNYPADRRGSYDETILHDEESAGLAAPRLSRLASLMLVLVLSLALWTAIWAATDLLVSVVLR